MSFFVPAVRTCLGSYLSGLMLFLCLWQLVLSASVAYLCIRSISYCCGEVVSGSATAVDAEEGSGGRNERGSSIEVRPEVDRAAHTAPTANANCGGGEGDTGACGIAMPPKYEDAAAATVHLHSKRYEKF